MNINDIKSIIMECLQKGLYKEAQELIEDLDNMDTNTFTDTQDNQENQIKGFDEYIKKLELQGTSFGSDSTFDIESNSDISSAIIDYVNGNYPSDYEGITKYLNVDIFKDISDKLPDEFKNEFYPNITIMFLKDKKPN